MRTSILFFKNGSVRLHLMVSKSSGEGVDDDEVEVVVVLWLNVLIVVFKALILISVAMLNELGMILLDAMNVEMRPEPVPSSTMVLKGFVVGRK